MTTAAAPDAKKALWLHKEDNVAVALSDFSKDNAVQVAGSEIILRDPVDYGHKFAVRDIRQGEPIVKYAEKIGVAARDILRGEHVHVHNVKSLRARRQ